MFINFPKCCSLLLGSLICAPRLAGLIEWGYKPRQPSPFIRWCGGNMTGWTVTVSYSNGRIYVSLMKAKFWEKLNCMTWSGDFYSTGLSAGWVDKLKCPCVCLFVSFTQQVATHLAKLPITHLNTSYCTVIKY